MSAGKPYKSTGNIALVLFVTAFSTSSGEILYVSRFMSTKTGFAPVMTTTSAVETNVKLGRITSSPFLSSAATIAECKAAVPVFTAIACLASTNFAKVFSNFVTMGPAPSLCVSTPLFITLTTASISSSPICGAFIGIILYSLNFDTCYLILYFVRLTVRNNKGLLIHRIIQTRTHRWPK